jgi:glyoxylase-like metal-dependent hydrolase (beta-lactamase superfamily II)
VRVHAIQTGSLVGNKTFMRGTGFSAALRPREDYEFPVYAFLLEHPEGAIMIDAGLVGERYPPLKPLRRMFPMPRFGEGDDVAPQMREAGLDPAEVRRVVLTHLHPDHLGGVDAFPEAEILVHRRELEFATSARGRPVYWPSRWPAFEPVTFDLDPEPYGPFPKSKAITASGDVRLVPIPGHAFGQVGVVVETEPARLLFSADHALSQRWFVEDESAGRIGMVSRAASKKLGTETSRRIHEFVASAPTVLVPSHDTEAPGRLARLEPITL